MTHDQAFILLAQRITALANEVAALKASQATAVAPEVEAALAALAPADPTEAGTVAVPAIS